MSGPDTVTTQVDDAQRVAAARRERRDEVVLGGILAVIGGLVGGSPWLVPSASHGFDAGTMLALLVGGLLALVGVVRLMRALKAPVEAFVPEHLAAATRTAAADEVSEREAA